VRMSGMVASRLVLEFEEGEFPRGRVVGVDGCGVEFSGWVELAAAIERGRGVRPGWEAPGDGVSWPSVARDFPARS
jgi:hypothetical protein